MSFRRTPGMPWPVAEDMIRVTYSEAAKLKEEMARPDGQPNKLDFSAFPVCFCCNNAIVQNPLVCSACKAPVYCSKKCQIVDWRVSTETCHKHFCEKNKRHMLRVPEVRAILKLFPWGKIESDGTFSEPIARAYYGVLGANGYGYWSESGGTAPHQAQPNTVSRHDSPLRIDPVQSYQDGYLLLLDQQLDDKTGWKLEDRLIPKLHFEPGHEPQIASEANVVDWKSWYQWRSLPLESPAALLMHYPLTVYHLLVNVLNVASPNRGSLERRQKLDVHYLGAEVELNMLPLFSELALLLPYTDIKLTFFGLAVYTIVQQGNKKSIAGKAQRKEPVFTYKSPKSMGQSTLTIYLDGEHKNWDPCSTSIAGNLPDVMVAPNAGLLNYQDWSPVILFSHLEGMPFGVTEYAEQTAEMQKDWFSKIIHHAMPILTPCMSAAEREDLVKPRQYPIEFNPFHCPGQRPLGSSRLPSISNGFTIRIVGKDSVKKGGLAGKRESKSHVHEAAPGLEQLIDKAEGMSLNSLD